MNENNMDENNKYAAIKIQKWFKKYLDNKTFIDPIYQNETPFKFIIRLPMQNSNNFFNFNIYTLIEWINIRGEPINPINNLQFSKSELELIKNKANKLNIEIKLNKHLFYSSGGTYESDIDNNSDNDSDDEQMSPEQIAQQQAYQAQLQAQLEAQQKIMKQIKDDEMELIQYSMIGYLDGVKDIILKNWDNIYSDKFNLNTKSAEPFNLYEHTNWTINNYTPLMIASYLGHQDIVAYLLENGCEIDTFESSYGLNAFQLALINSQIPVMNLLKLYGTNTDINNIHHLFDDFNEKINSITLAIKLDKLDILNLLEFAD
jgi:ankyrin repeat protein